MVDRERSKTHHTGFSTETRPGQPSIWMKPCPPFATCPHETYSAIETAPSATQSDTFIAHPAKHNLPTPKVDGSVPLLTLTTVTDSGLPRLLPSDGAKDNVLIYVESLSKFCNLVLVDKDDFIALPYISDPNQVLHEFCQGVNKREAAVATKTTENLSVTEEWINSAHPTPTNINDDLYIERVAGLESA